MYLRTLWSPDKDQPSASELDGLNVNGELRACLLKDPLLEFLGIERRAHESVGTSGLVPDANDDIPAHGIGKAERCVDERPLGIGLAPRLFQLEVEGFGLLRIR